MLIFLLKLLGVLCESHCMLQVQAKVCNLSFLCFENESVQLSHGFLKVARATKSCVMTVGTAVRSLPERMRCYALSPCLAL